MSRTAKTTVFIGDGEYAACLNIGELINLQEAIGIGPYRLAQRLEQGDWMVQDIRETIRFGLMGAGELSHQEIARLLTTYVVPPYLSEYHATALGIILAALFGTDEEELPEDAVEDDEGNFSAP